MRPNAFYWVPATPQGGDPRREVAILFDDRRRMEDRIYRLRTGYAWSAGAEVAHGAVGLECRGVCRGRSAHGALKPADQRVSPRRHPFSCPAFAPTALSSRMAAG
jgi:hypothetical protein